MTPTMSGVRTIAIVVALVLVVPFAHGQDRSPVKIGFIYTNTGPLAQLGLDLRDGFLQYWTEVGHRAGGRRVEILAEAIGTNKPDEGLTKARKLVERDGAHVLGGIIETPVAYALRSYVIDKKVPLMIMNAGADGLTQKQRSDFIFRSSFSNSQASHPLGEWAYKQGYRRMVLLASDWAPGHEHIGGVARTFVKSGGQVVQEVYPPVGAPDFAPYLTQIRRDADVVALAIFGSDAMRVISQYAELGLKLPIIGKYGITDEAFLQKLGDAAVGIVAAGQWSAALDNPVNRRVRDTFEAKHKRAMTLTVEQAYVGAQMLAKALETARGDVENLDGLLAALKSVEVEGPRGKVRLDAFHNPLHAVYMFKTERKGGVLQNTPIASVPNVSQFWTWSPEEYMALPSYVEMKGKWAK